MLEWEHLLLASEPPIDPPADDAPRLAALAHPHEGFDAWTREIRPRLTALARRLLWNTHDAEDVVQEALLLAWTQGTHLRDAGKLNAWVYRTTLNLSLGRLRQRRRQRPEALIDDLPGPPIDPAAAETHSELARRIEWGMSQLPEKLRVAMLLRDQEGLEYEAIAAVTQIRTAAARLRVHRAREAVRGILLKRWPDSFGTDV